MKGFFTKNSYVLFDFLVDIFWLTLITTHIPGTKRNLCISNLLAGDCDILVWWCIVVSFASGWFTIMFVLFSTWIVHVQQLPKELCCHVYIALCGGLLLPTKTVLVCASWAICYISWAPLRRTSMLLHALRVSYFLFSYKREKYSIYIGKRCNVDICRRVSSQCICDWWCFLMLK